MTVGKKTMGSRIGSLYAKDSRCQFPQNHRFQTVISTPTPREETIYAVSRSVILDTLIFFFDSLGMARLGNICSKKCLDRIMKTCFVLAIVLVMYTNGYSKETVDYDEAYKKHDDAANLTLDDEAEDDDDDDDFTNFMRPQQFTWGTLLGLLVASTVVVIGSFLVLWRLCCDVEMRVTREVIMEPLKSISQGVSGGGSVSGHQALLGRRASTSVLEIA